MKYVLMLLVFSFICKERTYSQGSSYAKYKIEKGEILYRVIDSSGVQKMLRVVFTNYGATEAFEGTLLDKSLIKIVKKDSLQTYYNEDSSTSVSLRKFDFITEYFVVDHQSNLFIGIMLAKPARKRYLKKQCQIFYHFGFGKNLPYRGSVILYKEIPLYIKIGYSNLRFVEAIKLLTPEISKARRK